MDAQFLVGDIFGNLLAELDVMFTSASWRLNDIGKVLFTIPMSDAKATKEILNIGNRVLIKFDNGLPNWGGTIELPRAWDSGAILCSALSAENVLSFRTTEKNQVFDSANIAYILKTIIPKDLNIRIGNMTSNPALYNKEFHFDKLLKIIQGFEDIDFEIVPSLVNQKIVFTLNTYNRKGLDKPNVRLIEGHNVSTVKLTEQGEIINLWNIAGAGSSWDSKLIGRAEDRVSMLAHGIRSNSQVFNDITEQFPLDAKAQTLLSDSKDSHNIFDLYVNDLEPAKFNTYDLGDVVGIELFSCGFGGIQSNVKILAREIDILSGICRLIVQEV